MGDVNDANEGKSISEILAGSNERYQGVGEGPDGPPPGLYKFQLVGAELKMSQAGKLLLQWSHVVLEGEHQGESLVDFNQPASEKNFPIKMMRQRIARLGWDAPENLQDLEELVPEIEAAGPIYTGLVKHSGSFANLEIKQLIEQYGASSGQAPVATAARATGQEIGTAEPAAAFAIGNPVSFVIGDDTMTGVIETLEGADCGVRVEGEEQLFLGNVADLTLVDAVDAPAEAPDAPPDGRDELVAFATARAWSDHEEYTVAQLVEILKGDTYKETELTAEELALLTSVGIPVEPAPKPAAKKATRATAKPAAKKAGKSATKKAAKKAAKKK